MMEAFNDRLLRVQSSEMHVNHATVIIELLTKSYEVSDLINNILRISKK